MVLQLAPWIQLDVELAQLATIVMSLASHNPSLSLEIRSVTLATTAQAVLLCLIHSLVTKQLRLGRLSLREVACAQLEITAPQAHLLRLNAQVASTRLERDLTLARTVLKDSIAMEQILQHIFSQMHQLGLELKSQLLAPLINHKIRLVPKLMCLSWLDIVHLARLCPQLAQLADSATQL